ncbi:MAG TPA: DUF1559 domain-containing protein, partial [Gemmataceae bacterium]|nr:DUF1559 domain-containing protein [Gemmataceae bacterium]
ELCYHCLGLNRILFVAGADGGPATVVRAVALTVGGLSADEARQARVAVWDDTRQGRRAFAAAVREFAAGLPPGTPGAQPAALTLARTTQMRGAEVPTWVEVLLGVLLSGLAGLLVNFSIWNGDRDPIWSLMPLLLVPVFLAEFIGFVTYLIDCGSYRERFLTVTSFAAAFLFPIGIFVPATQKVREAASRIQTTNSLKQMSLAMTTFADHHDGGMIPYALCDKGGKPLLSWRVALLPYIEQEDLYRQFKLDERWDGPHNSRLIARMPKTYAHPKDPEATAEGLTHFRVFTGPHTPFPDPFPPFPPGRSPCLFPRGIPDGTANTILIVVAADAVPWTKPDELRYDPNEPLPKLVRHTFFVGMADGSARVLRPDISEQTLRGAITPAGGEILGSDWDW